MLIGQPKAGSMREGAERRCIVSRHVNDAARMIRFVADPRGKIVPDIKHNLPGRGCWITAQSTYVRQAAKKDLFRGALKCDVTVSDDLAEEVDALLARSAAGALGLARKAGQVLTGAAKVENAIRSASARCVLHSTRAAPDSIRKLTRARFSVFRDGGPRIVAFQVFSEAELDLAFGGENVVHAALLEGSASRSALLRVEKLAHYRGIAPDDEFTLATSVARNGE